MTPERKSEIRNLTKPLIGGIANAREALGECLAEIDRLNAAARAGVVVSRDTAKLALTCIQRTHTFSVEFRRQHDEAAAELKDALEPTP